MQRRFAISDIHGCYHTLKHLIDKKIGLTKEDHLFLLGDYIDRGIYSRKVIDLIMDLKESGYAITALRGNHEQMLLDSINDKHKFSHWIKYSGGEATLANFRIAHTRQLADKYIQFFQELPYYAEQPDYWLVHAGFNFQEENILADTHAMIWTRGYELDAEKLKGKKMIHGHTPKSLKYITDNIQSNSFDINIDSGCVMNNHPNFGYLTAFNLDTLETISIKNCEQMFF